MSMANGDFHAYSPVFVADNSSTKQDRVHDGFKTLSLWRKMANDRRSISSPTRRPARWMTLAIVP